MRSRIQRPRDLWRIVMKNCGIGSICILYSEHGGVQMELKGEGWREQRKWRGLSWWKWQSRELSSVLQWPAVCSDVWWQPRCMELLYEASWREVTSGTYADPPPPPTPVYKRSKSLRALQDPGGGVEQTELWEHRRGIGWTRKISHEEFVIPRPKLIVPVHTYGVRKRRTGAPGELASWHTFTAS